jgi:hypothetical protein
MSADSNGITISDKLKVTWPVLVMLIVLTASVVTSYASLSATLDTHRLNCDVHHTSQWLTDNYIPREVSNERWERVEQRLTRIEDKLDKLSR